MHKSHKIFKKSSNINTLIETVSLTSIGHATPENVTKIQQDRYMFKCGEVATFKVSLSKDDKAVSSRNCLVVLSNDNGVSIQHFNHDLSKGNPFSVSGTLEQPGFLRCKVAYENKSVTAGAAFEPEKIKAVSNEPDDFDEFWNNAIKKQREIPNAVKLVHLQEQDKPSYKAYRVEVKTINDETIYGFMTVPHAKEPMPLLVRVPGASHIINAPNPNWASRKVILAEMNVHRIMPSSDQETHARQREEIKHLRYTGLPDRDKYYYRNSILAINAFIDYMAMNPICDTSHIVYRGASQGGAFGLFMGGINRNLCAIAVDIPAMCDHRGHQAGRSPGWPFLALHVERQGHLQTNEVLKMSGYFDAVNFAKRIKVPLLMTAGYRDTTCYPSTVYAAYNAATCEKHIIDDFKTGHEISRNVSVMVMKWLCEHMELEKKIKNSAKLLLPQSTIGVANRIIAQR